MNFPLEWAQRIAQAAVKRAGELGIRITVAVVDEAGHVVQLSRMDGAGWATPDIALAKARAAAAFRADTELLAQRFGKDPIFAASLPTITGGQLLLNGGAIVIRRGGEVIGSVGVSGARVEQDTDCASSGLQAISDLLETN